MSVLAARTPPPPPFLGAPCVAQSEAYAALIAEHLYPQAVWLDAGCGYRILEADLDPLEDWLVAQCHVIGMDIGIERHRNIKRLVPGSLYDLPFADASLDIVTSNMVFEHLDRPKRAVSEIFRCLRPGGAVIIKTPNLWNYGVSGNAIATKLLPERLRLSIVRASDGRAEKDIFPVRYKANTLHKLTRMLTQAGLTIHQAQALPQQSPYFHPAEKLLMRITPYSQLLVCAHKS